MDGLLRHFTDSRPFGVSPRQYLHSLTYVRLNQRRISQCKEVQHSISVAIIRIAAFVTDILIVTGVMLCIAAERNVVICRLHMTAMCAALCGWIELIRKDELFPIPYRLVLHLPFELTEQGAMDAFRRNTHFHAFDIQILDDDGIIIVYEMRRVL